MNREIYSLQDEISCAIYARFSSQLQREKSIEDQIRTCKAFAKQRGWKIQEEFIYSDKGTSGSGMNNRAGINKLMEAARFKKPPFDYILIDDTSRVARNIIDALKVFAELSFQNVYAYYVSQGIDTKQENAEELITLHGLMDARYLRELAKRTHRGLLGQVLSGYSGGGRRYGYRSEPVYGHKIDIYGNPVPDGYYMKVAYDEAKVVKEIFKMFGEEKMSAKKIVNALNKKLIEKGLPAPPRGKFWSISSLLGSRSSHTGILNNEMYIGKYIWNRRASKRNMSSGKKITTINSKINWIIIQHPELKIIEDSLWMKVKNRQREIRAATKGLYVKGKALYSNKLLSGLLKCDMCGGNIVIVSGGKYSKYGCSNNWHKGESVCSNNLKIEKRIIEEKIITEIEGYFKNEGAIKYVMQKTIERIDTFYCQENLLSERRLLEAELKTVEKELENICVAIKRGLVTRVVEELLRKAELKKKELTHVIEDKEKFAPAKIVIFKDTILKYFENLHTTLNLQPIIGRSLLSTFFDSILLNKKNNTWVLYLNVKEELSRAV